MKDLKEIILTTINAKWIHPSLALRLLKANLGELEDRCEIIEFALRQPLSEKLETLAAVQPKILGISVSIWNHAATIELLKELKEKYLLSAPCSLFPIIIVGGPEVSYLPVNAEIFNYVDYVIRGEGEIAFRELCEKILAGDRPAEKFINTENVDVNEIKTAYHLYTDEDVNRKLIYVESSRGCPYGCEFCLSAASSRTFGSTHPRFYAMDEFLTQMEILIKRGVKTFKFLDRTFNANIKRAIQICEFFLEKLNDRMRASLPSFTVHFEIVPTLLTLELIEVLSRFPPAPAGCEGSLRLEIGIQTLNPEVASRIKLPGRDSKTAEQILEPLRLLREKTNSIIHADLIAGLPGEDLESFGKGFDALYSCLFVQFDDKKNSSFEIQLGILKQLPGAPISRHAKAAESGGIIISSRTTTEGGPNDEFKMCYNTEPPYEVMETSSMSAADIARLKNFARFWELLVNRGLVSNITCEESIFNRFMALSDALLAHFGRNWGIDKEELIEEVMKIAKPELTTQMKKD